MNADFTSPMQERMYHDILESIDKRIAEVREEVIKKAVADFESDIRAAVGGVALRLSNYFSVERAITGQGVVITVQILDKKEGPK